jgi:hypothetical protein
MSKKKTKPPKTKFEANWRFKTLEALEKSYWGEPTYDSHLVTTCHALRKKPLKDFTTEDLRIMIGQDIGLKYLVPLALETLEQNILADGDLYDGDLLQAVLSSDKEYWIAEPDNWKQMLELYNANLPLLKTFGTIPSIRKSWFKNFAEFEKYLA